MSDIVISAEGLSKSYLLGHQFPERQRYTALRDVIAREVRGIGRKALDFARGRQIVQGDEVEKFWALKDVSFQLRRGEVLGIIGPNGAGKSTLLKILSRITEPDRGRAILQGRVAALLEVGTGFHPELTGRENIFLNGAILGMTRVEIKSKLDEIVAFAEVDRFLDTPVKRYSSGMYLRLAFSIAAHLRSEILIVDEVLAVGDADFQEKCLGKLNTMANTSERAVLFVTHNMAAIQQLCGRAILIRQGVVAQDGSPVSVVREYLAGYTREAGVSVRDWPDRLSNGDGRIVGFEILDDSGRPTTSVPLGGCARFRISAEIYCPGGRPMFGVLVHSRDGEPMLDLRSHHDGLALGRASGRIVVQAEVRDIGLYPGEYMLSPWFIWAEDLSREVDWVQHCGTLRVMPTAGPNGDLKLDSRWGKYYLASRWSLIEHLGASTIVSR